MIGDGSEVHGEWLSGGYVATYAVAWLEAPRHETWTTIWKSDSLSSAACVF